MSMNNDLIRADQVTDTVADHEDVRKRREWVRFIIPHLVTRLSWQDGTGTVLHLVTLVNVSAIGAAVSMHVKPPSDRPCMILFDDGNDSAGPITAKLVSIEVTEAGRVLATFKFDATHAHKNLIRHQKECRAWQRMVPRNRHGSLSWRVGAETISVPAEVQNISGGGVAVRTDVTPPWNQPVWLFLGPAGQEPGRAECRLVGLYHDSAGKLVARMVFVGLCPLHLYQASLQSST